MFQKIVIEKLKTHTLYSVSLFGKSRHLRDNVEKYGAAKDAADDNMAALSMLYN
jgi:hypothetical protein